MWWLAGTFYKAFWNSPNACPLKRTLVEEGQSSEDGEDQAETTGTKRARDWELNHLGSPSSHISYAILGKRLHFSGSCFLFSFVNWGVRFVTPKDPSFHEELLATERKKHKNRSWTPEKINQWQFMTNKWDLQTQVGALDELRWVEMVMSARWGQINERTLLLLILLFFFFFPSMVASLSRELLKASLMVIGTDLSMPSAQLCLWHFIKLLLTKRFYLKTESFFGSQVANYSSSLDLS